MNVSKTKAGPFWGICRHWKLIRHITKHLCSAIQSKTINTLFDICKIYPPIIARSVHSRNRNGKLLVSKNNKNENAKHKNSNQSVLKIFQQVFSPFYSIVCNFCVSKNEDHLEQRGKTRVCKIVKCRNFR